MNSIIDYLLLKSERNPKDKIIISLIGAGGKTSSAFWLANLFKQRELKVCITTSTKMFYPLESEIDKFILLDEKVESSSKFQEKKSLFNHISNSSITFCFANKLKEKNIINEPTKVSGISLKNIRNLTQCSPFDVILIEADGSKGLPIKSPAQHEPCIAEETDVVIAVTGAEVINRTIDAKQIHRWEHFQHVTHCNSGDMMDHHVLTKLVEHPLGMFKHSPKKAKRIWQINKVDQVQDKKILKDTAKKILNGVSQLDEIWLTSLNKSNPSLERLVKGE